MKSVGTVIGVMLIILLLGAVMLGIQQFRSAEYTEPHVVATGLGVSTASINLTNALFDSQTSYVTITSNVTGDAAIPYSYTDSTKILVVSGLVESSTHYLTVVYRYNQLDSYWGADIGSRTWPVLLVLCCIAIAVGASVNAFRHVED